MEAQLVWNRGCHDIRFLQISQPQKIYSNDIIVLCLENLKTKKNSNSNSSFIFCLLWQMTQNRVLEGEK